MTPAANVRAATGCRRIDHATVSHVAGDFTCTLRRAGVTPCQTSHPWAILGHMPEMIEGTAGTGSQDRQDPDPGPGTPTAGTPATGPAPDRSRGLRDRSPVPRPVPVPDQDPATVPAPVLPAQDQSPTPDQSQSADRDQAARKDPAWLTWGILAGFILLSIIATVLTADGQAKAAQRSGVPIALSWLAPGVLELVSYQLWMLGYRRGRHAGSPTGYWVLAAAVSGWAIYLTTENAPTLGAALFYGGASGALGLLAWLKFREDLKRYQRDVLKRLPSKPPAFGMLWATRPRIARRAWLLSVEFGLTETEQAKTLARTWCVVFDETQDWLRSAAGFSTLTGAVPQDPDPAGTDPVPARHAVPKLTGSQKSRARDLARRAADARAAQDRGLPFHIPTAVEVATVAVRSRPGPTPPVPDPVRELWDQDSRTGNPAPVSAPPAGSAPVPPAGPGPVPDQDRGPAWSSGLTIQQKLALIPGDVMQRARDAAPGWDPIIDLARLDAVIPHWNAGSCPTKTDVAGAFRPCGNNRAADLRRMIEAMRAALTANATSSTGNGTTA